jgi:hypothetical protein
MNLSPVSRTAILILIARVVASDKNYAVLEVLANRLTAVGLPGRLHTAFVERLNLTLRQGVAVLARRTWGA